jgi:hypothetical protein
VFTSKVLLDPGQIRASLLLSSQFRSTFHCWRADQAHTPVKAGLAEEQAVKFRVIEDADVVTYVMV